jgi:hypothetical protein
MVTNLNQKKRIQISGKEWRVWGLVRIMWRAITDRRGGERGAMSEGLNGY